MYFQQIDFLPTYSNLYDDMLSIFESHNISWPEKNKGPNKCLQICLNHVNPDSDDIFFGSGSDYNYLKSKEDMKVDLADDRNFIYMCRQFNNTVFEEIHNNLKMHYQIGRMRLIKLNPHLCLGWHKDAQDRLHYPIKTKEGVFMVIEDEPKHLQQNKWYLAKTTMNHAALNASNEDRIHLLVTVWGVK